MEREKISRKRRGIAVLTLAALFFWYLPQIQVNRQIRKEQEEAVEMYVREEKEEAGISNVRPVSEEIFSLESLTVDGHVKKGKYVSSHLHFNLTYLLEADSEEAVSIKADENSGVAWFSPEEALMRSTEPWFVEHVYIKLLKKMNLCYNGIKTKEV